MTLQSPLTFTDEQINIGELKQELENSVHTKKKNFFNITQ